MSFGMPRLVAKRFAVPAGMIARLRLRAGEHVDAALHHAVAAPGEHELGALVERAANLCGALRLFGTSHQNGSSTPSASSDAPQLCQAAAERLAGVRDHGDLHACALARASAAAPAARHANTTTISAADSDEQPAGDVERMVHAAVHAATRRRTSPSPARASSHDPEQPVREHGT